MASPNKFTVVDLFAGAGGFSLAAKMAGGEIRFAVENDPHAVSTYKANLCASGGIEKTTLYDCDINRLGAQELNGNHFGGSERCDLLLGGPPCQGFSTHRIRDAGISDPRNNLIHRYFDFVKALSPKIFLMENVPGLLWRRHESYLKEFYRQGRKANYQLREPIVIDARDFGLPQRRKRVFILGLASDVDGGMLDWPPKATHIDPLKREPDSTELSWQPCKGVFRKAPRGDPNNLHMNHGPELVAAFSNTPINGGSRKDSGRLLECHKAHDGHKDVYGRIDPRQPAPTMTTACINPSKGRFVHPTANHGITVRQAARIQTFPDDYIFHGGLTAAGCQVGNAVPVELGKILITHLVSSLLATKENEIDSMLSQLKACA